MFASEPFPLDAEEIADVRAGVSEGCVFITFGSGAEPWCVFHADACDGHWHLQVKFHDGKGVEKTIPAEGIEAQLISELSTIKGFAFKSGVKKVMN